MTQRRKFQLCSQRLEDRTVLAGNVNVVLAGVNLKITGDVNANDITIVRTDATHLQITGNNGTNILLNGANPLGAQTVTVADFTKLNLSVDLKEGDDVVALGQLAGNRIEIKKLTINTGTGADNITVQNVFMSGTSQGQIMARKVNVATEADVDVVNIHDSRFVGGVKIFTGFGGDEVNVDQTTQVDGVLNIDTSGGDDLVTIDQVTTNKAAVIALGDGNDFGMFSQITLNGTAGTTKVSGGAGIDNIGASNIIAQHALQIDLEKTASGTSGNTLNAAIIQAAKITVNGGGGVDRISAGSIVAPTMVVKGNGGSDQILATQINSNKSLTVDAGAGDNDVVTASNLTAPVGLVVDGGAGIGDTLNFTLAGSTLPPSFGLNSPKNFETKNIA